MSNFAAISAAANNVTANSFTEFPGENPTKVQLEEWIEAWDEDMNQAGFGAFTRDELPYDVAKLVARPLLPLPTEADKIAAVTVKNSEITYHNNVLKIEQEGKLIEIKNRLASRVAKAMKKTAKLRLQALQTKHVLKKSDGTAIKGSFDGDAMYKELRALVDSAETEADVKAHLKVVERLRDTPMHDNCTSQ